MIGDLPDPFRHFGANPPLYYASKAKMKGNGDVERERKCTMLVRREEEKWKKKKAIDGTSCLKVPLAAPSTKNESQVWREEMAVQRKMRIVLLCLGSLGKEGCTMSILSRIRNVYGKGMCKDQHWMWQQQLP